MSVEFRFSTLIGAAGDSLSGVGAASFGKYMSRTKIPANAIGNLFPPVTPAQAETGLTDYRCLFVLNNSQLYEATIALTSQGFGGSDISLGIDPIGLVDRNSASAQAAQIANAESAPAGVDFLVPTLTNPIELGTFHDDKCVGLWVRRRTRINPLGYADNTATITLFGYPVAP